MEVPPTRARLAAGGAGAGVLAVAAVLAAGSAVPPRGGAGGAERIRYLSGPPPAHTGGFGEPTCRVCHFDRPLNPEPGEVRLEGVPSRYVPDSVYAIDVVLEQPELKLGGFQLAARWRGDGRAGCSAGELRPADGDAGRVAVTDTSVTPGTDTPGDTATAGPPRGADGGEAAPEPGPGPCRVPYAHHTKPGSRPAEPGRATWRVLWEAPSAAAGPVAFHVAANAANDDASRFGDRIYAARAVSRPRSARPGGS